MSGKGRSAEGYKPDKFGFYETPESAVRALLPKLNILSGMRILESGCGRGAIAKVLREEFGVAITITGIEIDAKRAAYARKLKIDGVRVFDEVITHDFLELAPPAPEDRYDISVGNPWFAIFQKTAEQNFLFAKRTCLLLPTGSLASKGRFDWWQKYPAHMRVLDKRPSFAKSVKCSKGKDNCSYQEVIPVYEKRKARCPVCAESGIESKTTETTSDSNEYGFFEWGPDITHGMWSGLRTPPARKKEPVT